MMDVMEDDHYVDETILDDDEERELAELERYINGGVHPTGILPGREIQNSYGGREIQTRTMRPQSEIVDYRAPSEHSTLVMGTRSLAPRPASTVATTTVLRLHQPREMRGNVILYDKTPSSSYSFVKVAYA